MTHGVGREKVVWYFDGIRKDWSEFYDGLLDDLFKIDTGRLLAHCRYLSMFALRAELRKEM